MPFDNTIKLTSLQGKYIISLINTSDIYYSSSITGNAAMGYYINGVLIDNDAYYTVAAVDYIFDKTSMPFQYGIDSRATGILFRDVLEETLESYQDTGWTINPR
jgi:hypothetical protein